MELAVIEKIIDIISTRWPGKALETFAKELFEKIPGVGLFLIQVIAAKAGIFLIQYSGPLSDEYLHENVPVQCKNYSGDVDTDHPINDLKRSFRNSESTIAYLFILEI